MSVVMADKSPVVAQRARELGFRTHGQWSRRYGRNLHNLSEAKALDIMNGVKEPPTPEFPDRWLLRDAPAVDRKAFKAEWFALQLATWAEYFHKEDAKHGDQDSDDPGSGAGVHLDDPLDRSEKPQRPVFGQPIPRKRGGTRSGERDGIFGGGTRE